MIRCCSQKKMKMAVKQNAQKTVQEAIALSSEISMPEIKKGNNIAKKCKWSDHFNLCKMAGHAFHLYQVS